MKRVKRAWTVCTTVTAGVIMLASSKTLSTQSFKELWRERYDGVGNLTSKKTSAPDATKAGS